MIEKVNPAHPDKIADRIAGALVDYAYSVQSNPRIAVEALIGHRVCHIIAETSVHIPATFVQDTVTRIAGEGVVMDYCEMDQDAHLAANQAEGLRCGDNGIFKGRFYVQFNIDGLMRGDYKSRMEGYAIARQNGWMSANDIRALENQNPIPAEEGGDAYLVNGNMISILTALRQGQDEASQSAVSPHKQSNPERRRNP